MDLERTTSAEMSENEFQWHQDQRKFLSPEDRDFAIDSVSDDVRLQNKVDRPKSRRGIKDFSRTLSSSSSGSTRYGTGSRMGMVSARPPTSSTVSNHAPSAVSRISLSTSSGLTRLNTGIPPQTAIGLNMIDRPITQHGIAGVRPETTRGLPMTRQILDRRYYVGLLQLKIRELGQEISSILRDIDNQNKEKAKLLHCDKRAKELAVELTALQGKLADYNIVVDKMTSDVDKESIEMEVKQLAVQNEHITLEIEDIFEQRKNLERMLNEMKKELEVEKQRTERLVNSMDENTRDAYENLLKQKVELQEKANQMQKQLDVLTKEQIRLEEEIALSPLKQEAVKLHLKIMESEEKRNKLKEEEGNKLPPELEKERLLQKVKQDNADIAAAEAQLAETMRKITDTENQLEQFEMDMEDTQTEKQMKYNELRKREEMIEQFMSTFDQNKEEEKRKLKKWEETIVERLSAVSNVLNADVAFVTNEEMTLFNSIDSYDNYELTDHDQSIDGLSKEHLKLQHFLNKMELLENKLKTESIELKGKIDGWRNQTPQLENIGSLKVESEHKREELIAEHDMLKSKRLICEQDLKVARDAYNKKKQTLENNQTYIQINNLEDKLELLQEEAKKLEKSIQEQVQRADYVPLKERTYSLVNKYSSSLKESLKSLY